MVIIYKIDNSKKKLKFEKNHAKETEDGLAWRVRIINRDSFNKPTDTFTEHVIPKKDILDIQNDLESRDNLINKHKYRPINPITNI